MSARVWAELSLFRSRVVNVSARLPPHAFPPSCYTNAPLLWGKGSLPYVKVPSLYCEHKADDESAFMTALTFPDQVARR